MVEFKGPIHNEGKAPQEIRLRVERKPQPEQQAIGREQKQLEPYRRELSQPPTKEHREGREAGHQADAGKAELSARARAHNVSPVPKEQSFAPDEVKRFREVVNKSVYELTTEDWGLLNLRRRDVDTFVNTLGDLERKTWHDKQEEIGKERIKRAGESVKRMFENSKDHYPSWWEVYDKDGRRIWKMNLLDKAILAEWRRYDSLPPQERAAELREWMRTHIKKEETWGGIIADFGVAILLLIMFLLSPEDAEKILEEMEIAEGRGEKSGNEKKEKFGLDFRSLFGSKETAVSETPTSTLAMH